MPSNVTTIVRRAIALSLTGCIGIPQPRPAERAGDPRPNIVFLFADDHAAHAISAYQSHLRYGVQLPKTPNLDRLASDGMLFVNSFVTNSICAPARATVLTGQYGHINGVMTNSEPLHPTTVTFPSLLRNAGYTTGMFGKWHLRTQPQGFDRYEILAGQGPYYNPVLHDGTDSVRHTGYTLDIATTRALEWMDGASASANPFMMILAFNGPHRWWDPGPDQLALYRDTTFAIPPTFNDRGEGRASPARDPEMKIALDLIPRDLKLEPPNNLTPAQRAMWDSAYVRENAALAAQGLTPEQLARWKYQRYIADYMRVIAALDQQVGRVLARLDEKGLTKNTMVVYTSDQGFFLGDHGWFDKRWMYEESLRTPLIIRWPESVRAGTTNDDLVMNLDLAETFLDVAGVKAPAEMQGRSILPLLKGNTPADWRDAIYYQYFEYPGWHAVRRQYGVRTDRYKLIHYYEVDEWELFDLERDPEELTSVYADPGFAGIRADLEIKLASLRHQYSVPAADPAPYYPWELPPEYRRPGTPGSTRNSEIGAAGMMHHSSLKHGIAEADSVFDLASVTKVMATTLAVMRQRKSSIASSR
ncbi:MAG: sulfatase family protein [Gemmatimonadaceae bacterium]